MMWNPLKYFPNPLGTFTQYLGKMFRGDSNESPKALVLYQSAAVLAVIALTLTVALVIRIIRNVTPLDGMSVAAFSTVCGFLAGLAGFHTQNDPGAAVAGKSSSSSSTTVTPEATRTTESASTTDAVPAAKDGGAP